MKTRLFVLLSLIGITLVGCNEKEEQPIPVKSVTVEPASVTLEVGQSKTLTATVSPGNADDKTETWSSSDTDVATVLPADADIPAVTWSSSNEGVASVAEGKVTAHAEGTATITATADGKCASCLVTVIKKSDDGALKGGIEGLTEDEQMDFRKLRVGILGDSISTFEGTMCNPDYTPYYPAEDPNVGMNPDIAVDSKFKTWWWRLVYYYMPNATLDANSSWSGSRVIHEEKKGIGAGFVDRAYDFVNPDVIIIHGGTNDNRLKTPLGDYDWDVPVGEGDLSCFRSAYVQLVKMLQSRYEGVQLILIIGDRLGSDYENSIKEIAQYFGLPYVNFVGDDIPKCYGSHPTAQGHAQMTSKIWNTCKDYLQ